MTALPDMPVKRCSKCGEAKPATTEYFCASANTRSGLSGDCRGCRRAYRESLRRKQGMQPASRNAARDGMKRCSKCREVRSVEIFGKDKRKSDGLQSCCKICRGTVNPRISLPPPPEGTKRCNKCGEVKPTTFFNRGIGRDGYAYRCKRCERAYRDANLEQHNFNNRAWRRANIEKMHEKEKGYRNNAARKLQIRQWRRANIDRLREYDRQRAALNPQRYAIANQKRRARLAGVGGRGVTAEDIQAMIYMQQGLCAYCERDGQKLTLDHIIPIDQKGPHDPDNCCMCCGVCNSSKGHRTPEQWKAAGRWFDFIDGR